MLRTHALTGGIRCNPCVLQTGQMRLGGHGTSLIRPQSWEGPSEEVLMTATSTWENEKRTGEGVQQAGFRLKAPNT